VAKKKNELSLQNNDIATIDDSQLSSVVPYLNDTEKVVVRENCKLCQSEFRQEAEDHFAATPNYKNLLTFLRSERGMDISYPAVRNHIIHHTMVPEKREFLCEYAKDIKKWADSQQDKVSSINNIIGIMTKELTEIASEGESLKLIDRCKNAETIKKLADGIMLYQDKKHEYEESLEPVVMVLNQLKVIIEDELENNPSIEAKRTLVKVLQRLQDSVGDLSIKA
jgi:hypothetical protein